MLIKPRLVPIDLQKLTILDVRMELSAEEKFNYSVSEKGYEGELKFDHLTNALKSENLIIRDLLLKVNNSLFQIDTMIIFQKTIYLIDVKNYEGDYCFKDNGFYKVNDPQPKKDPLAQLKRAEVLCRQLIQKLGFHFSFESYLVFVNPEFTLYQDNPNHQIISPTQVNKFIRKIEMTASKITPVQTKLGEKLIAAHIIENPYSQVPFYTYESLKMGHYCTKCHSFSIMIGRTKITCKDCGSVDTVEDVVLRSVEEIRLLFPEMKITTGLVQEWCQLDSDKMVRRILKTKFKSIGKTHNRYYE